jgi:hypothetical protein
LNNLAQKENIKLNFLDLGSPALRSSEKYRGIAGVSGGQQRNFWSFPDQVSWPSAFGSNSERISAEHDFNEYTDNLRVRQTGLSMVTGMDIPITYSRAVSGTISDPYFSATYRIQEIKSVYASGITSYKTQSWSRYSSGPGLTSSNLYTRINPLPPIRQSPSYSPPSRVAIPAIPAGGRHI